MCGFGSSLTWMKNANQLKTRMGENKHNFRSGAHNHTSATRRSPAVVELRSADIRPHLVLDLLLLFLVFFLLVAVLLVLLVLLLRLVNKTHGWDCQQKNRRQQDGKMQNEQT